MGPPLSVTAKVTAQEALAGMAMNCVLLHGEE